MRASDSHQSSLAIPGILFGLAIGLAVSDMDRKRLRDDHEQRALMLLIAYSLAGVLVLWLGGRDLMRLVSVGLLMTSSFMFFTGFIVRGPSEGVNDTLDFVSFTIGIAAVIACRICLNCVWWETLLPLVLSAGIPGFIRMCLPRTDLPPALRSLGEGGFVPKDEPILLDYKKEQKARRERKRERQIAALRRSQKRR